MKSTCYRHWNSFRAENIIYVLVIEFFWLGKNERRLSHCGAKGEDKFVVAMNMNSDRMILQCPTPMPMCVRI